MKAEKLTVIKGRIKENVLGRIDTSKEISDEEIMEIINEELLKKDGGTCMSIRDKEETGREVFYALRKLDILQDLLDEGEITEIMVNGPECIFLERKGRLSRSERCFESTEKLADVVQQIVSLANRTVNESKPIADARLKDGSRVNIVLPPVAINGPVVTIRKFPQEPVTIQTLLELDSISHEAAGFLEKLVMAGYNIFISGGTGSGKTTFLNVLSNFIPADERIITIEDSAELQIRNVPNLVRLEARNANVEGGNAITIRDLIKTALRMRPDRIIIGEIRDEAAVDMLSAFNTGHDGSLSTGHANSPADMMSRLETLVLMGMDIPLMAVRRQIASAIDIVVHLGRIRDKSRRVLEITEIAGCEEGEIIWNSLYFFEMSSLGERAPFNAEGRLVKTKNKLIHRYKLERAGIIL